MLEEILAYKVKEFSVPCYKRVQKIVILLEEVQKQLFAGVTVQVHGKTTMEESYCSKIKEIKPKTATGLCHRSILGFFSFLQNTSGQLLLEVVGQDILKNSQSEAYCRLTFNQTADQKINP